MLLIEKQVALKKLVTAVLGVNIKWRFGKTQESLGNFIDFF